MAGDPAVGVTETDLRSLAAKLKGMHALLTPGEQRLLLAVLRRAAAADRVAPQGDIVSWAVSFNPFIYLDSIAADLVRDLGS